MAEDTAPPSQQAAVPPMLRLARASAREAESVELHGTVVHRSPVRTVALYAGLLALCAWSSGLWPVAATVLFLALLASGLLDLQGRRGWARGLLLKDVGQTLLTWTPSSTERGPALLVLLPAELRPPTPSLSVRALYPLFVVAGLTLIGLLLRGLLPEGAGPLLGWTGGAAAMMCVVALIIEALRQRHEAVGSEAVVLGLLRRLRAQPVEGLRVAIASVDDGFAHFDGTETLLLNHTPRLPPDGTRVLTWLPGPGPLVHVPRDGRVKRHEADPSLRRAAEVIGLPAAEGVTPLTRAASLGWSGLGLTGGVDALDQVVDRLHALIRTLDAPHTASSEETAQPASTQGLSA